MGKDKESDKDKVENKEKDKSLEKDNHLELKIDYHGLFDEEDYWKEDKEENINIEKEILEILASENYNADSYNEIKKKLDIVNSKEDFRYNYYEIYAQIRIIIQEPEGLDRIIANVRKLEKDLIDKSDEKKLSKKDSKLIQYVKLEAQRSFNNNNELEQQNKDLKKIRNKAVNLTSKINSINRKLQSQQTDYIAVLGVFSAIVLGFTGGLSFTTSILDNVNDVGIYRILLITLLLGFILGNGVYLLLKFIKSIGIHGENGVFYIKKQEESEYEEFQENELRRKYMEMKYRYMRYKRKYNINDEDNKYIFKYVQNNPGLVGRTFSQKIAYIGRVIMYYIKALLRTIKRKTIAKYNFTLFLMSILVIWAYRVDFFKEEEHFNNRIKKYEEIKAELEEYKDLIEEDDDGNFIVKKNKRSSNKLNETTDTIEKSKSEDKPKSTDKPKEKDKNDKEDK